jgi:predicted transcriptional regulator
MIILCSKCGERFESLIIDQELAYKEVFNASCRHVKTKHAAMFAEMARAIAVSIGAMTTFMHFEEFVVVPEDETKIQEGIMKNQEVVMVAMGFDPEDDEEDEDEDTDGGELPDVGVIELPDLTESDKAKV